MASSGAFETSEYSGVGAWPNRIRIEWSSTQNTSSNTSTISWNVKPMGGSGRRWCQFYNITIVLGGITIASQRNLWGRADGQWSTTQYTSDGYGGTPTSFSGSFTLTHDANGQRTLTGSAECAIAGSVINSSLYGYSVALPTIARASSISVSGNTMGSPLTVNISKASSSFTHTLTWQFGNQTGTIASNTSSSSVTWTPPITLASQIPNATSGYGTIWCTTYNGGTNIGQKSINFTLQLPSNITPSISSFTSSIASTKPANCGLYVKNHSTVRWNVSASGAYGSTIQKCVINGQNLSYTSTSSSTSYSAISSTLTIAGEKTYTVTVTDSRGRTASATGRITIVDYNPPVITAISSFRSNANGSLNGSGEYVTHQLTSSFYTLNGKNNIKIEALSKKSSDSTYSNSVIIKNDSSNTVGYTYTYPNSSFKADTTYDFKIVISDSVGQFATVYTHVGTKNIPINISEDNNSVAIGGFAQTSKNNNGRFDCVWEAHFATAPITDSDRNLKHNIKDINIDIIDKLRPVQYNLINEESDVTHYGFIAQDVEHALIESGVTNDKMGIVYYDENNETKERTNYALSYDEIIPLLVKKCQELQREIDRLKGE